MQTKSYNPEKEMNDHPQTIGLEQMDIIRCKMKFPKGVFGTGFFCKIQSNLLPVLITNNHYWMKMI